MFEMADGNLLSHTLIHMRFADDLSYLSYTWFPASEFIESYLIYLKAYAKRESIISMINFDLSGNLPGLNFEPLVREVLNSDREFEIVELKPKNSKKLKARKMNFGIKTCEMFEASNSLKFKRSPKYQELLKLIKSRSSQVLLCPSTKTFSAVDFMQQPNSFRFFF